MTGRRNRSSRLHPNLSRHWAVKSPLPMPPGPRSISVSDPLFAVTDLHLSLPDMTKKPLFGAAPRIEILKGLNFAIAQGAITGIVGESGSGKTSLGRTLIRLLKPDSGAIYFAGSDIAAIGDDEMRPLRR